MNLWIWICFVTLIWIPNIAGTQEYNDDDTQASQGRAGQPKPPSIPGQGDRLPFKPGGGYQGPGNSRGASFGFNSYKGPTHGDFDTSVRKFSKDHTLGSFGNSFDGTGDHASVMNKVYNRLQNNGANHYNKEPTENDNSYKSGNSGSSGNNFNRNGYNSNRPQSGSSPYHGGQQQYSRGNSQNDNSNGYSSSQNTNNNDYSSSQGNNGYYGSNGKDSSSLSISSSHDKNLFPEDLFDFSKSDGNFKGPGGHGTDSSGYNQGRQAARSRPNPQGSGYRQRPNPRNNQNRQNTGYNRNRGSGNQGPPYLSSQYKGFGNYGYGGGGFGGKGGRNPYGYNPTRDMLTHQGGTTLLQVTNARVPKAGSGSGYGRMIEDNGRAKAMIEIRSGGSAERNLASGGGFGYENILEDDHSLTDIVSAVATVVGQGDMNPSALGVFSNAGVGRPRGNNFGQPRPKAPSGLYTNNNAYHPGRGYAGGSYVTNHQPLNNGDGGAYVTNQRQMNSPRGQQSGAPGGVGGGLGGFRSREPSLGHLNGENSFSSFEDSIQNLVF